MKKSKKQLIKQCMLTSTRESCGLGSPPKDYNQNINEGINSMIKGARKLYFTHYSYVVIIFSIWVYLSLRCLPLILGNV